MVTAEELGSCPFCAGHEQMTPPETLVLPEGGDWRVRVDHPLTERWPCVAGFNEVPAEKTIVLVGYASR